MTIKKAVSVLVITYNHEDYLARALDSILMQKTDFDFDIIVGEDASSDSTRGILQDYAGRYPSKIRPIFNECNRGMMGNLRQVIEESSARYLALLEGDDYWIDDLKLQKQYDLMNAHPEIRLCGHRTRHYREDDDTEQECNLPLSDDEVTIFGIERLFSENLFLHTSSYFFRGHDTSRLAEYLGDFEIGDIPLLLFFAQQGPIALLGDCMSVYRVTGRGVWSGVGDTTQNWHRMIRVYETLFLLSPVNKEIYGLKLVKLKLRFAHVLAKQRQPIIALKTLVGVVIKDPIRTLFILPLSILRSVLPKAKRKDLLPVHLFGGLGNQMFQYAAGRAFALRHGISLKIDVSAFVGDLKRSYALAPFCVGAQVVNCSRWSRAWRKMTGMHYREKGFAYDPTVLDLPVGMALWGHFQSEKYFITIADRIRADFALREPLSEAAQRYLKDIETGIAAVAVHIRRGDYIADATTRAFHGNCSWKYYENAMRLMRERVGGVSFFFFSDEPDWLVAQQVDGVVVRGLSPHEDMFLISRCRHQIIANSSFSWWGAWLNQNPDKIVIAPKRWFADEKMERQTGDLIPSGWVRL